MCGMKIVPVGTDAYGNINIPELKKAAETHKDNLSALMVQLASFVGFVFGLSGKRGDNLSITNIHMVLV